MLTPYEQAIAASAAKHYPKGIHHGYWYSTFNEPFGVCGSYLPKDDRIWAEFG